MLCRVVPIDRALHILPVIKLLVEPDEHESKDDGRENGNEGGDAIDCKSNNCEIVSVMSMRHFGGAVLTISRTRSFGIHIAYVDRTGV